MLHYLVEVAGNPNFTAAAIVQTADAATSYEGHSLPANRYWVRVSAVNQIGVGPASAAVEFTVPADPMSAPGSPLNLAWTLEGARLTLSWQPGAGGTPASYSVEAGLAPGQTHVALSTESSHPAWVYEGVPPGVFFVRVRAVNGAGTSAPSNEVVIFSGVPPPPAPPVNLGATVAGSQVSLTWSPGSQPATGPATHFVLEAGSAPGASNYGALPIAASGVVVGGVPPGLYYVRVRAANSTGWSSPSNEIVVQVP